MSSMGHEYPRDPLSERFDVAATQWLERAYRVKGDWSGQFLAPPGPSALAWCAAHGINPLARDKWGERRWVRAFKRSVFWQARWYGGVGGLRGQRNTSPFSSPVRLVWHTGPRVMRSGWAVRRWSLQLKIVSAGDEAERLGHRARRRWTRDGTQTEWASTLEDRDYA